MRKPGRPQQSKHGPVEAITFYLPPELKVKVLKAANQAGKNRSAWVVGLLRNHFAQNN